MLSSFKMIANAIILPAFSLIIAGCMSAPTIFQPFTARDINDKFESGFYIPKTDTLYIVLDSSASMNLPYLEGGYQGQPLPPYAPSRFDVEREIIRRLTETLPEMELNIAVRTFGYGSCLTWEDTLLNFPLQPYSLNDFQKVYGALECASGGSPIDQAIKAVNTDLKNSAATNISLILISDGEDFNNDPMPAVQELKASLGDRLCLDSIWLGDPDNGEPSKATLQAMSDVIDCGQAYEAKSIASPKDMANLVRNIFMTAVDRDEDGVPDFMDNCPGSFLQGESPTGMKITGVNTCTN